MRVVGLRVVLLTLIGGLGLIGSVWAQADLPTTVSEPYRAYTQALESNDLDAARDAAREAWEAAETARYDAATTAVLADNYAALASGLADHAEAHRAYRRTAEILDSLDSGPDVRAETWLLAARSALGNQDFRDAVQCAGRGIRIVEGADELEASARGRLLFSGRALESIGLWREGRFRRAARPARDAMDIAEEHGITESPYFGLLSFYLGASAAFSHDMEESAYWLSVAYSRTDEASREGLGYWVDYTRGRLDPDQAAALLIRLGSEGLGLPVDSQPEADDLPGVQESVPVRRPPPEYPREAAEAGIEGLAVLRFAVDESGGIADIEVLYSIPYTGFGEASVLALRRWQYEPRLVDGVPTRQEGMVTVFDYRLGP